MLATGGSAVAAIQFLKNYECRSIKLMNILAAPEGIQAVPTAHPDVEIYVAAVDEAQRARLYCARPGRRRRPDFRHEISIGYRQGGGPLWQEGSAASALLSFSGVLGMKGETAREDLTGARNSSIIVKNCKGSGPSQREAGMEEHVMDTHVEMC